MKGLATLIKLHKRTLDELRRKMVALETQKRQLQQVIEKLQQELEHEMELAKTQAAMSGFFGGFAKRIQNRQLQIHKEIASLDQQMAKLGEEISAAFSELKKFEIARDNAKRRERAEENRKDTIVLDEIAGQQHQRRKKNEPA